MNVSAWMVRDPVTIKPTDTLDEAQEKMSAGQFRRLPVIDDTQTVVGIITDHELREHKGYLANTLVRAALVENPLTIRPDDSIERAAQLILEHKIGGLPVLERDGRLVGMITVTDLLRGFLLEHRSAGKVPERARVSEDS